ncbi:MAG: FG-GAP-like repeat-containing protein [Phycisphaerales bacterium]
MRRACLISLASAGICTLLAPSALAQWVNFSNQTATRLVAAPSLVVNDNLEKDFAWGDLDNDGDVDLVVVRKFPGSIQGGMRNLLLMNEGGVLVDRTTEYASASDVAGDAGFLAKTNDRDVEVADVNNDGWLDVITATTMSDQVDAVLGQPRVYINLGNNGSGQWQGLRFEDARIPVLTAANGSAANPRFCDMAVADLTGDGYVDLFFTDYDTPETSGTVCIDLNGDGDTNDPDECQLSPAENAAKDYQNKFLVNQGASNPGFFTDTMNTRMTSTQLASAFGNSVVITDLNGDGLKDIVRVSTLTTGQNVATIYGKNGPGTSFNGPDQATGGAPYQVDACDINNDGKMDLIVADDSKDKFLINTGNGADGYADFTAYTINDSLSEFGNTIHCADLDNDGYTDVMICDVDADLPPFCPSSGRRMHIYRNTFATVGLSTNTLDEVGTVIPNASLNSTFDVAPIDINGDGWLDLVIGRCAGIEVWMNQPPLSISFSYPGGLPATLVPDQETSIQVQTSIVGGGSIVAGTALIHWSVDGGAYQTAVMTDNGGGSYTASLAGAPCGSTVDYYFSGDLSNGPVYTDPSNAPVGFYSAISLDGVSLVSSDSFEGVVTGWTVTNTALTGGAWEVAVPNGTVVSGAPAAPSADATPLGAKCWVTQNGVAGGAAGSSDVDGGPTQLVSPSFSLAGEQDGLISYARWFYCDDAGVVGADAFVIEISNDDGATWVPVESVNTNAGVWVTHSFLVSNFVAPTGTMRLRFTTSDNPNNSTTEAGLDDLVIQAVVCNTATPCPADLNADGVVDGGDLGIMLGNWGTATGDLNGDGTVDGSDLGIMLGAWGVCLP